MPWDFWLILLVMAVYLPWRGRQRLQKLMAMPVVSTTERLSLYVSTIAFQWASVALVGWRAWARGLGLRDLGLVVRDPVSVAVAAVGGAALLAGLQWMNLRRVGRLPLEARGFVQAFADRVLPHNGLELMPFLALAVTAGVCEEFLFRGFVMGALGKVGLVHWEVVGVSALLFGLGHLYQGRGGVISTLLLGIVFGVMKIAYDTLAVVVLWHIAVDVVAGCAGCRYLVKPQLPTADTATNI